VEGEGFTCITRTSECQVRGKNRLEIRLKKIKKTGVRLALAQLGGEKRKKKKKPFRFGSLAGLRKILGGEKKRRGESC